MSKNPVNGIVRFLLEFVAVLTFAKWGYNQADSWRAILLAIFMAVLFAALWGVFAVRNDPSRSGKTVVPTSGPVRLGIELALFGAATWMLFNLGHTIPAWIFGAVTLVHYAISYDRIFWLLKLK
jgi:hypothetical protein